MQTIPHPFFGAVGAIIWLPAMSVLSHGFASGCANGSIHIYMHNDTIVSLALFFVPAQMLIIISLQSQYLYYAQEAVHDGPVLDVKFDLHFGWLASVGGHAGH